MLKRLLSVGAIWSLLLGPVLAQSTINPTVPAQNSPLSSAPVRSNFANAYGDINGILGMHAVATLGQCASQPLVGTDCLVVGSPISYLWYKYMGIKGYALVATFNPTTTPPLFSLFPPVFLNANVIALPTADTGTLFQTGQADGVVSRIESTAFGARPIFTGRRSGGTNSLPAAVGTGDVLAEFNAHGYTGSAWTTSATVSIQEQASQSWTPTAQGTQIDVKTTPNGAVAASMATVCRFENDGGVTCPNTVTGGSKGAGTINAAGLYINGSALSAGAANITVGTTIVNGGPGVLYNTTSGGTLAALAPVNSSVVSFTSGGVLQASTSLPSGVSAANMNLTTPAISGSVAVTSASACCALTVGPNGATNPVFQVDASTVSQAAGIKITGAVTAGVVAIAAIDSGPNTNLSIDAKGSGQVVFAQNSTGQVTVVRPLSLGTGTIPSPDAGTLLQGASADGTISRAELTAAAQYSAFTGRRADGTLASPTTLVSADLIATLSAHGYDGSAWSVVAGALRIYAEGTWSNTSHPTEGCISTTPISSTTIADAFCVHQDGGATIGIPTGGNEGIGTLNLQGNLFNNGTAPTGTGAYVRATSPTLVTPTLGAASGTSLALGGATIGTNALAVTGTSTFSGGSVSFLGTVAPSSAGGSTVVLGTITPPTLTNAGQAYLYNTVSNGAAFQGMGSSTDLILMNKNGGSVCSVPTGTQTFACASVTLSSTINGLTISTTTGTLAIGNGSTLTTAVNKSPTFNNSLTFAGTDGTTLTFQGTDTYVGRATTDTLTNKTFDTAGTGNSLKINGTTVNAISGTGSTLPLDVEGTWTPTIIGSTSGGYTLTQQNGTYERIGRHVTVRFFVQASAASSPVGNVLIGGLPLTNSSDLGFCYFGQVNGTTNSTNYTWFAGTIGAGASTITLEQNGSGQNGTTVPVGNAPSTPAYLGVCEYHV